LAELGRISSVVQRAQVKRWRTIDLGMREGDGAFYAMQRRPEESRDWVKGTKP
jgi:hypothetical protein